MKATLESPSTPPPPRQTTLRPSAMPNPILIALEAQRIAPRSVPPAEHRSVRPSVGVRRPSLSESLRPAAELLRAPVKVSVASVLMAGGTLVAATLLAAYVCFM